MLDTTVSPKTLNETDDWSSDMTNLDCNSPIPGSTTTCTFDLPSNRTIPVDSTLAIGDSVTNSDICTQTSNTVTCTNVPTGSQTGDQDLFVAVASGAPFDTNENVVVGNTPLTTSDVTDATTYCESTGGLTTTCYMILPPNTTLPTGGIQLGVGADDTTTMGGVCTESTNMITCTGIPVDVNSGPGVLPVFMQIGADPVIDSGEDVYIFASSSNDAAQGIYEFTPARGLGGTTPLFKDSSPVTIIFKDFSTGIDPSLVNYNYNCTIEVAPFQPNSETQNWITLADADDILYDTANGCSGTLPKSLRGTRLNWSAKTTIVDTSDPSRSFEFYDAYAFVFAGSGA